MASNNLDHQALYSRELHRKIQRLWGVLRAERRDCKMNFQQFHSLLEMQQRPEGVTGGDLAVLLRVDKSSISRTLNSLRKRGLVEYREDESDRRRKLFTLTKSGEREFRKYDAHFTEREENALAQLSERERATVLKGFQLYCGALETSLDSCT